MITLLAIDGSSESAVGLEVAANFDWPSGAKVVVLTVVPPLDWYGGPWAAGVAYTPTEDVQERLRTDREGLLQHAAARLRQHGLDVTTRLIEGRPASVIVETAREIAADLVIVGARGHGAIEEAVLGSVSAEVVDQASCAVFVARRPSAGRVLIGTDGSDVAMSAGQFVARCGLFQTSQIRVVHAVDVNPTWWLGYTPTDANFALGAYATVLSEGHLRGEKVTSSMASLLRTERLAVTTVTVEGSAAAAIVDEAKSWRADVVVVGSRGNGLLKRLLLGSTARSVMHHADASVLITRPMKSGWREPGLVEDPVPAVTA